MADLTWPGTVVEQVIDEPPGGAVLASLALAHRHGVGAAAVIAGDAPDLPGLLLGKLFRALGSAEVAVSVADGGGLVALASRLPAPAWLTADLAALDADALVAKGVARDLCAVGPSWHRLRAPADVRRLDPGLEGWANTRSLLSSPVVTELTVRQMRVDHKSGRWCTMAPRRRCRETVMTTVGADKMRGGFRSAAWRRRLAALVAVLSLVVAPMVTPAAASAASNGLLNTHFVLGAGAHPDIALGPDGTAHVAWVHWGAPGVSNEIQYCRVPRGKRACTGLRPGSCQASRPASGPTSSCPGGNTVLILSYRCCFNSQEAVFSEENLLLRSDDGGVTFKAPQLVGTHSAQGDAILGPNGTFYTIDDVVTGGVSVQRAALDGSATPLTGARAHLGTDEYGGSLAALPDGSVLAAHFDGGSGTHTMSVSRFSGTGDPNTDASWPTVFTSAASGSPKTGGQGTELATGKKGTYLFSRDNEVFTRFQVRKWNGTTFAAPTMITPAGQDNIFPTFWEDPAGRTAVAYSNDARKITYRASDLGGWSKALVLPALDAYNLRGATAADGGGFVAYDGNAGDGSVSLVPIPAHRLITESVHNGVVSGKVVAFKAKQPVVLQKAVKKAWVTVATHKLNAKGAYSFTLPKAAGSYRAVAVAVEGYGEADGKPIARK